MKQNVLALLTDFGQDDFFVASLKGVITSINPSVKLVDICHRVSSFDVRQAGFILFACYRFFPEKTVFLSVVDPGVGSSRKILAVRTQRYFFVAPDNGLLSFVLEEEKVLEMRELKNRKYFLPQVSSTFEARDKMAPAASWLSKGTPLKELGPWIDSYQKLEDLRACLKEDGIEGSIVYVDKFGNLITNIPLSMVDEFKEKTGCKSVSLQVKGRKIDTFVNSYSDGKKGELFFLAGSLGLIEIASRESSASKILGPGVRSCIITPVEKSQGSEQGKSGFRSE
ncbi:MAG: S-adenosyl-l-methionine hydroxide adenosyltransferase family protein [Candidatus Aminicenantales bacterium]